MTKDETRIKDWRSTGRRKARRELYSNFVTYACVGFREEKCGKTTISPPEDAPKHFDEIWPEENRVLTSQLQADHEDKDVTNNDLSNLNWRCPKHHKMSDQTTAKGESTRKIRYI